MFIFVNQSVCCITTSETDFRIQGRIFALLLIPIIRIQVRFCFTCMYGWGSFPWLSACVPNKSCVDELSCVDGPLISLSPLVTGIQGDIVTWMNYMKSVRTSAYSSHRLFTSFRLLTTSVNRVSLEATCLYPTNLSPRFLSRPASRDTLSRLSSLSTLLCSLIVSYLSQNFSFDGWRFDMAIG